MKRCSKCKENKSLDEFRNDKYTKSGKTTRCKECLTRNKDLPIWRVCRHCKKGFWAKQSNWRDCSPKCHNNYWSKIWRLSKKGTMYMIEYHRNYEKRTRKVQRQPREREEVKSYIQVSI